MFEEEYDDEASIPKEVKHLFRAEGDKFIIIPVGEIKTVADVNAVQEGLRKERNDHKDTKSKLSAYNGMDPKEINEQLARIPELEASQGKIDEEKTNQIVEARITARLAPVQNELKQAQNQIDAQTNKINEYETASTSRKIQDSLREAGSKLSKAGMNDFMHRSSYFEVQEGTNAVVTKEGIDGVIAGVTPDVYLTNIAEDTGHWYPAAQNANARGGKNAASAKNPFTRENWNLTEQGKVYTENPDKATQLASAAGTTVGGGMPEEIKK